MSFKDRYTELLTSCITFLARYLKTKFVYSISVLELCREYLIIRRYLRRNLSIKTDFIDNEYATLACASRVVIHSIFVLGPSALGMGESYL